MTPTADQPGPFRGFINANGSPADERGDDDTPGGAAAVGPDGLLALGASAAQPEGVEEEEDQVQGQAGQSDAGQQHDGL